MTIGELETETGVPASTIRYWERIGVLPKPARVGGQRRYGPDAVPYLAVLFGPAATPEISKQEERLRQESARNR
jgi:hypothetical protein